MSSSENNDRKQETGQTVTGTFKYSGACCLSEDETALKFDPTFSQGSKSYFATPEVLSDALITAYHQNFEEPQVVLAVFRWEMVKKAKTPGIAMSTREMDENDLVRSTCMEGNTGLTVNTWIFEPAYPRSQLQVVETLFIEHYFSASAGVPEAITYPTFDEVDEGYSET